MNVASKSYRADWAGAVAVAKARGEVVVLDLDHVKRERHWQRAFASERLDSRYYEIVERTLHPEFTYRYFVMTDKFGTVSAIQPFFLLDLDILAGVGPNIRIVAQAIRRFWPAFLRLRTLMAGCVAGEGHLDGIDPLSNRLHAGLLAKAIVRHARGLGASHIVLKEFPAKDRDALEAFRDAGFGRIPSMPHVKLDIRYANFEEFASRALTSAVRNKLRKKLRASACSGIKMDRIDDLRSSIDEVYPLYLQVYDRSKLHFEKLTPEFLCQLAEHMPDKVLFFGWRQDRRIVAFGFAMTMGKDFYAEYLGLDYRVAIDLHLYHRVFHDLVSWAIAHGFSTYHSSSLNYDPKLHLRYRLDPVDLYARLTSPSLNVVYQWLLPFLGPTRYDNTLCKFSNYSDL